MSKRAELIAALKILRTGVQDAEAGPFSVVGREALEQIVRRGAILAKKPAARFEIVEELDRRLSMPFKSKAQQRYMHAAAERGEIKKSVVKEYDDTTNFDKLPEKKAALVESIIQLSKEADCDKQHKAKAKAEAVKKLLKALGK